MATIMAMIDHSRGGHCSRHHSAGPSGRDVCLTVVGDGVVGLGVGSLVVRSLVGGAVGRHVGLMVVGDGHVGLGVDRSSADRSTSGSFLLTNAVD